jgi:hypothetical protein
MRQDKYIQYIRQDKTRQTISTRRDITCLALSCRLPCLFLCKVWSSVVRAYVALFRQFERTVGRIEGGISNKEGDSNMVVDAFETE